MSSSGGTKATADPKTGSISVGIYDGARELLTGVPILMQLRDGNQKMVVRQTFDTPNVRFAGLTPFDNFGDNYAVIAAPGGYRDAGFFPVKVAAGVEREVSLLSLPKSNALNFARAKWPALTGSFSNVKTVLAAGAANDAAAATRYSDLLEFQSGAASACLLNLMTSMNQTPLGVGTAVDYLNELIWDREGARAIAGDRFFAWADPALIDQLEAAKARGQFEPAPYNLHPGATRSYKQTLFGEADLQLTFHENERKEIGGKRCVMVEPDIDYYRDLAAHVFLEVLMNAFGSMTDPKQVMALRWIAGRQAGLADFDPLFTVEKA